MAIDDNTIYGLYGSQIKDIAGKIEEKQDELVAGEGVTITDESGSLVISAEGTTYTAGDGIDITNAVISATNTGKARELTSADYNYPTTGTKTEVALWLLEPGVYYRGSSSIKVRAYSTGSLVANDNSFLISSGNAGKMIFTIGMGGSDHSYSPMTGYCVNGNNGTLVEEIGRFMTASATIDNLTSNSTTRPLSANQGRVLKDLVDSIAIRASGAPTTSTVGSVGTLYEDTTNGKLYQCTAVSGSTYTWAEVGAGGGGSSITVLTSADYDYPDNNPTSVAAWRLPPGMYTNFDGTNIVQVYTSTTTSMSTFEGSTFVIGERKSAADNAQIPFVNLSAKTIGYLTANGYTASLNLIPTAVQTTGTSTTDVMSQDAVTKFLRNNSSSGSIGVVYDGSVPKPIATSGTYSSSTGGSVILSPSWIYGCGDSNIIIGNNQVGPSSYIPNLADTVSIGDKAHADYRGSIALGSYSQTSAVGEMNIGSTFTSDGYNSSNYRLLTGLYDPQNAHDAATKGYCDNALSGKQDALTAGSGISIADESGSLVISATATEPDTFTTNEWNALWA